MTWDPLGTIGNAFVPGWAFRSPISDRQLWRRSRVDRDRLIAEGAAQSAPGHGVAVIEVDGSRDADSVAGLVVGPLGLA